MELKIISKVIYNVTCANRKDRRKELLESAQNGMPTKLEISILDGKSPLETISQLYLENDVLGLSSGKLIPLSTSYTQGNITDGTDPVTGGAPEKDADELSDEGSNTREGGKKWLN